MLDLNYSTALGAVILTGFLWGSWYTFIKVIPRRRIWEFTFWLYIFANVISWSVLLTGRHIFLPEGISAELQKTGGQIPLILLFGAFFGMNIQLTLRMMGKLGIIFSISISSTFGVLVGTLLSALLGGLPEHVSLWSVMAVAAVLLCATFACQFSGYYMRQHAGGSKETPSPTGRDYALFALNVLMGLSFTLATNLCCRTVTNPRGMAPLLFCSFLGTGALLGTFLVSSIRLIRERRWLDLLRPDHKMLLCAFVAAVCHFGGDVIYMIASPSLSMSVAWPLCSTSNLWSYFWGVLSGEYRGCGKKAAMLLSLGIVLFVTGVLLMSSILYW